MEEVQRERRYSRQVETPGSSGAASGSAPRCVAYGGGKISCGYSDLHHERTVFPRRTARWRRIARNDQERIDYVRQVLDCASWRAGGRHRCERLLSVVSSWTISSGPPVSHRAMAFATRTMRRESVSRKRAPAGTASVRCARTVSTDLKKEKPPRTCVKICFRGAFLPLQRWQPHEGSSGWPAGCGTSPCRVLRLSR